MYPTDCDREPIHIPGSIQPHGVLLAFREPTLISSHISSNVKEFFGLDADELLGRPIATVLGEPGAERIRRAIARPQIDLSNPLSLSAGGRSFDGTLHRNGVATILELEPRVAIDSLQVEARLRVALTRLYAAQTADELGALAVEEVRSLTEFDRVMLYRFDQDDHGEVVQESKASELESFKGLHYPASDIPSQARALYALNWIRTIPDALYLPVPILPVSGPDAGAPLDLSFSVLRSISPVHAEYLTNMGVRASMSISVMRGRRLWGLIACHSRTPRIVPFRIRSACELLGRFLSLEMDALFRGKADIRRNEVRVIVGSLVGAMRSSTGVAALVTRAEELLQLVDANGAAVVDEDGIRTTGVTPSHEEIAALLEWLRGRATHIFHTSSLPAVYAPAKRFASRAAGLLALSLPTGSPAWVLWFRPEVVQVVTWAGDPSKTSADSTGRLRPRKSFEAWKEMMTGQSLRWTEEQVEGTEELRRAAIELDLKRQVRRAELAIAARDELVAVVSHDLRNPLNVVKTAAHLLKDRADAHPVDCIVRAVATMESLIGGLLDLARVEAGHFVVTLDPLSARALVDEAVRMIAPLAEQKSIQLEATAPDVRVRADRDRILQVFSNLLGNAVKFTPAGGQVIVSATRVGDFMRFMVDDSGPGIDGEQLTKVFDRYWQAPGARRQGSGLGLFIAKGIVEAHGGALDVESVVGRGTTFSFTIPLAAEAGE